MLEKRHRDFAFECEAVALGAIAGQITNLDRLRLATRVLRDFRECPDACDAILAFCDTSLRTPRNAGSDLRKFAVSWHSPEPSMPEYDWQQRADLR